jgi:hypothetical protein
MDISKLNEIKVAGRPNGWVVKVDRDGERIKSANFGVYVTTEAFVAVPIHFVCIENLVKINGYDSEGTTYYGIPAEMKLKLIKTKVKNAGKIIPMLVPCKEGQAPSKIACLTFTAKGMDSIIDIKTANTVVREFIPADRKVTALILTKEDNDLTPLAVNIVTGVVTGKITIENTIVAEGIAASTEIGLPVEQETPVVTKFIKLKNKFIRPLPTKA